MFDIVLVWRVILQHMHVIGNDIVSNNSEKEHKIYKVIHNM